MNTKKVLSLSVLFLLLCIIQCVNLTDTYSIGNNEFFIEENDNPRYQLSKRFYVVIPEDTTLLCGTKVCSTFTNGVLQTSVSESSYVRIITQHEVTIHVNDTDFFVFPQKYHYANKQSKLGLEEITHYIIVKDSQIVQPAYSINGKMYQPDPLRRVVLYKPIEVGYYPDSTRKLNNCWPASPFVHTPKIIKQDTPFNGQSVAFKALSLADADPCYWVNNFGYKQGVEIKTYYPISYEYLDINGPVRVVGTSTCTQSYFWDRGLIEQGFVTILQKQFSDGKIEIIKEIEYISRLKEAKKHPDVPDSKSL